jgi:hypothetical protein
MKGASSLAKLPASRQPSSRLPKTDAHFSWTEYVYSVQLDLPPSRFCFGSERGGRRGHGGIHESVAQHSFVFVRKGFFKCNIHKLRAAKCDATTS